MGGFLCVAKSDGEDLAALKGRHRRSIDALGKKGLSLKETLDTDHAAVFVFDKVNFSSDNVVRLENGDFIVGTGTLFYQRRMGAEALRRLHQDFAGDGRPPRALHGHYGILLRKNGRLYVFNDYSGLYRIYRDETGKVLSNSLLAVKKSLDRVTISDQELYEYISHGGMYGDHTLIAEIKLLDSLCVHQLWPEARTIPRPAEFATHDPSLPFDEQVSLVVDTLRDYFRILKENFGDRICTALSGGYDSRLMLAVLRSIGVNPYVYVYGADDASDVRVSKTICEGEKIPLHHEKSNGAETDPHQFPLVIEKHFHVHDGHAMAGVFGDGSDLLTRQKRTEAAELQLNGGGGGSYRNAWKLPDRPFHISGLVKVRFDRALPGIYTERYDRKVYLRNITDKVKRALKVSSDRLSRDQVERMVPMFRLKYWMGQNNSCNNLISYALTPYAEPMLMEQNAGVPLKYKQAGRFEAALIRHADPRLAKYRSNYGINFYDPIPLAFKLKNWGMVHAPIGIRPFLNKRMQMRRLGGGMPFYLREKHVGTLLNPRALEIARYVNLDNVRDPVTLNRALTVELLMTDRF